MSVQDPSKAASGLTGGEFVDTNVTVSLQLDGQIYDLAHFSTDFYQEVDHKNQPQNETHGGKIKLMLSQIVPDSIYLWAKSNDMRKDGSILFQTQSSGTVLNIAFENAHCISLSRSISASSGTMTALVIAPEFIKVGKTTHDNRWGEK